MGWYTTGPRDVHYKWGDVVTAARESGVGELEVCPRLYAEELDNTFFLREQQIAARRRGLPWTPLRRDPAPDEPDDFVPMLRGEDERDLLAEVAANVAENAQALAALLGQELPREIVISLDFGWSVEAEDYAALLAWLNAALPSPVLTLEALGRGEITRNDWYEPPADLAEAFEQLEAEEGSRHLAACMLGAAVVSGEKLRATQPDEACQATFTLEQAIKPIGVVLFRPADHPFLDRLAAAFGVPEAERACVFYVCRDDWEIELPPEGREASADAVASGLMFAMIVSRLLSVMDLFSLVVPEAEEGAEGRPIGYGWHADASSDALSAAFGEAGLVPLSLAEYLEPDRSQLEGLSEEERLEVYAALGDEGEAAGMGYLRGEGELPAEVGMAAVVAWLLACPDLDLPEAKRERMGELLDRFAKRFQ